MADRSEDAAVLVDAEFAVEFSHPDGRVERWTTGLTYCEIAVHPTAGALPAQLDVMAKSAVQDVISDMSEAGIATETDLTKLPVHWTFDPALEERFELS